MSGLRGRAIGGLLLTALLAGGCGDPSRVPDLSVSDAARGRWDPRASLVPHLAAVAASEDVQPGHPDANGRTDTTWCNRGFLRVAVHNDHDVLPLLDPDPRTGRPDPGWTSANDMVRNVRAAASAPDSTIERVDARTAQARADEGRSVLAGWFNPAGHGHVGHVVPSRAPYDPVAGPLLFETGAYVGVRTAEEAFGEDLAAVEYYVLPFAR